MFGGTSRGICRAPLATQRGRMDMNTSIITGAKQLGLPLTLFISYDRSGYHRLLPYLPRCTRSSDENSVRPSVCSSDRLSNAWIVTKRKRDLSRFYTVRKNI